MITPPDTRVSDALFALQVRDERWPRPEADWHEITRTVLPSIFDITRKNAGTEGEICLVLTNDAEVARLNNEWRGRDGPTNVLSFPAGEARGEEEGDGDPGDRVLGDVILAYETIAREAADQGKTFRNHTVHLLIHGVLHLLGYDHQNDEEAGLMEALESRILTALDVADPWATGSARMTRQYVD